MRSRHRYSWPPSRRCLRAVTWSGRPRPGRGRRPPSRFPSSSGSSPKAGGPSRSPWCSSRRANSRCRSREAMHSYGHDMGARVLPVYGGEPIGRQLGPLKRGVDVVVATPGRALDHINRGTLKLSGLEIVVLDEADEMLDMGFAEEIEAILGQHPREAADRTVLGDDAAADRRHGAPPPARPGAGRARSPGVGVSRRTAGAADCLPRAARAQARRSRSRARPGEADGHGRLLPDQGRGGPSSPSP